MTPLRKKFIHQFRGIQRLVWFQRGFRWLLRGLWGGALVFLIGWLLHYFFGWLPGFWVRLGLAVGTTLILSFAALFVRPKAGELAWRMDRRLGLKARLSTAWQVAMQKEPPRPVEEALLTDASQSLPALHLQILKHGWGVAKGLLILLVVLIALVVMFVLTFPLPEMPTIPLPGAGDGIVPGLGGEPSADDLFPGGVPGMDDPGEGDADSDLPGDLEDIFAEISEDLAGQTETDPLSEALGEPDLGQAADALEDLADQIDQLPEDVRQEMAESFADAAPEIAAQGYDTLADQFANAAKSLQDQLESQVEDIQNLADGLRGFGEETVAEPTPDPATPEPIERLDGDGQSLSLDPEQAPESDLLVPAESAGEGQAEGDAPTGPNYQDEAVIDTILVPYSYPWYWQDLISDYFTP